MPDLIINEIVSKIDARSFDYLVIKDVYGPDEIFFQTMAMQTEYSQQIEINNPEMVEQNCKTFAFFHKSRAPFTGHPYVIDSSCKDLCESISSDYYFARKFDFSVDRKIIDYLDSIM